MKRQILTIAAASVFASTAGAQVTWSQSTDNTTIASGSASCLAQPPGGGITDNSYWRLYDPVACGLAGDYEVLSVRFGVEDATEPMTGAQMINVNIRDGSTFPAGASSAPILGTTSLMVMDTDVTLQTFETAVFSPPVFVPAGTQIAVEVMALDGIPNDIFFFIGSNTLGETPAMSSFLSAAGCGIVDPVWTGAVGFDVDFIIDVEAQDAGPMTLGVPDTMCIPLPNSASSTAIITLTGNGQPGADIAATVAGGVPGQFGYFISGPNSGLYTVPPGSTGLICVGGPQYRYNGGPAVADHLFAFDGAGNSQLIPGAGGPGPVILETDGTFGPVPMVMAGQTRAFQAWYRDIAPFNSNFSDSRRVTF